MAKFSEQVRIARETGTFVVLAASEAKAVVDELDALIHDNARAIAMNAELATDAAARESAAASAMRERCAQACDDLASVEGIAQRCAAAIRGIDA